MEKNSLSYIYPKRCGNLWQDGPAAMGGLSGLNDLAVMGGLRGLNNLDGSAVMEVLDNLSYPTYPHIFLLFLHAYVKQIFWILHHTLTPPPHNSSFPAEQPRRFK